MITVYSIHFKPINHLNAPCFLLIGDDTLKINHEFFLIKLKGGCMLFGSVTYQPKHPFGNANIKVKEQWRMQ